MVKYSTLAVVYISLQSMSLFLLSCLMVVIIKSKSFFLKWTLLQLCVSAFMYGFTSLPPIIIYGNNLMARAFENPLCIIMQKVSLYFLYPLEFFSIALAFYLWHALYTMRIDFENRFSLPISIMIWISTTIYNGMLLKSASHDKNWNVKPTSLSCKLSDNHDSFIGYYISSIILAFFTLLMTCHSTVILWRRWMNWRNRMNRTTAIRLGEAVRDEYMVTKFKIIKIASINSALIGTYLFLIFGTERKAAIFLPFYYVPPGTPHIQEIQIDELNKSFISQDDINIVIRVS
ncbi:12272_t:CDS:2 [Funneliformis mosseae]|uniref:12272_t:CDS:1 n=1 Tax=Funneliformis mosseae TaxID=27381 RepID=A0A9N8VRW9_FUNMO|nr:12272_t:CDS:2 [Funneliformis mosseae]